MSSVRLFYGSTNGNTHAVAELLQQKSRGLIESITDIAQATSEDIAASDALIFGTSTWEMGDLQKDWKTFLPQLSKLDLRGKTVALYGLGDATAFSGLFAAALRKLYDVVLERGAAVVGAWPAEGYSFECSPALLDGHFVGLVIDQDNEPDRTCERVCGWIEMIRGAFGAQASAPRAEWLGELKPPSPADTPTTS